MTCNVHAMQKAFPAMPHICLCKAPGARDVQVLSRTASACTRMHVQI